jgi:mannosyltransferase
MSQLSRIAPDLDLRCDLVGDPINADGEAYLQELNALIASRGLQDKIRLAPGIPFQRAHEAIAEADIFVNTADTDSVDKAVLEALSCGVPVITSNAAFQEILPENMHSASLVPKNDVDALARAIRDMCLLSLEHRNALAAMGRRLVVERHSLQSLADRIMSELNELVARGRQARGAGNAGRHA